jgi:hypothetical protein
MLMNKILNKEYVGIDFVSGEGDKIKLKKKK